MPHNTTPPHFALALALGLALSGCLVAVATGEIEAPEESEPPLESNLPALIEMEGSDIALMDAGAGDPMGEITPVEYPAPTGP